MTKQRRIIHFSSGETLEEKDSEEEEDQPSDSPFRESEQKVDHCSIDNQHVTYNTQNIRFFFSTSASVLIQEAGDSRRQSFIAEYVT